MGIIFASGDSGSGYQNNKIWPSWPASSPWVTSVGATKFKSGESGTECAVSRFGSGGGFSSMFVDKAKWQDTAVSHFFSTVSASSLPPSTAYNKKGRGTPDVAALGNDYLVIDGGHPVGVGGTSASTPPATRRARPRLASSTTSSTR